MRARAGDVALIQNLFVQFHFRNLDPEGSLFLTPWPATAVPGQPLTFHVTKMGEINEWGESPGNARHAIVQLTSPRFGDLLDEDNPELSTTSCPRVAAHAGCRYTGRVLGEPGTTFEDTITLELSDGTGPTTTIVAEVAVALTLPPVRDAAEWAKADTPWPTLSVNGHQVDRGTPVTDVFVLPRHCKGFGGVDVQGVLTAEPPTRGWCHRERRLVRAAVVTLLNEAGRAERFPPSGIQVILTDTNHALRWFRILEMSRLTGRYEAWNAAA